MTPNFYKNKSILVTGHTGFVGSWLSLWLNQKMADITGLSLNIPSNPYHYKLLDLARVKSIRCDIRDRKAVAKIIKDCEPDMVFHLAAQPILLKSYENPVETYLTNVIGTLNLLEACRNSGSTKAVVNVTTDKVYENKKQMKAYVESDRLGGHDPYSSSKACSEFVTAAYRDSFLSGIGVATARAGNILGGGDWGAHRLMPDLFSAGNNGRKVVIRHKDSVRPWTHVLDILNGYLTLGESLYKNPKAYSEAWNFSSKQIKTVVDVINEMSKYYKVRYTIKEGKQNEEKLLLLDSAKARKRLGWKPKLDFRQSIKLTASWYNVFYKNQDAADFSEKQLREFQKRLHG